MHSTSYTSIVHETPDYEVFTVPSKSNLLIVQIRSHATDAVPGRFPSSAQTQSSPADDGTVNYYEEAEQEAVGRWKRILGALAIEIIVKPAILEKGGLWSHSSDNAILLDFPIGYKLFVHRKGDRHTPRRDYYLMGSRYARIFRSPQEFIFHLKWLLAGRPLKGDGTRDCSCCYCDPEITQGDLSRQYSLGHVPSTKPEKEDESDKTKEKAEKQERAKRIRPSGAPLQIPAKDYTKLNTNSP